MRTALIAAALLPLSVLVACDDDTDSGRGLSAGRVLDGGATSARGTAVAIQVPDGRFDFVVSDPGRDLPFTIDGYDHANDGASLVGVTWTFDHVPGLAVTRTPGQRLVTPRVSLVAGDEEYSIDDVMARDGDSVDAPTPIDYWGTAWVAVDGEEEDVDDLTVRVEYDGLIQDVPVEYPSTATLDRGVARALYVDATRLVRARGTCGAATYDESQVTLPDASCRVTATVVPYQQSVGWVDDPEQAWLVVDVVAFPGALAEWRGGRESYAVDGRSAAYLLTLGDQQPVAVIADEADEGHQTVVFASRAASSPDPLVVNGRWHTTATGGAAEGTPVDPDASATWTVQLYG